MSRSDSFPGTPCLHIPGHSRSPETKWKNTLSAATACSTLQPVNETLQADARRRKRVLPAIHTTRAPSTFGTRRRRSTQELQAQSGHRSGRSGACCVPAGPDGWCERAATPGESSDHSPRMFSGTRLKEGKGLDSDLEEESAPLEESRDTATAESNVAEGSITTVHRTTLDCENLPTTTGLRYSHLKSAARSF